MLNFEEWCLVNKEKYLNDADLMNIAYQIDKLEYDMHM